MSLPKKRPFERTEGKEFSKSGERTTSELVDPGTAFTASHQPRGAGLPPNHPYRGMYSPMPPSGYLPHPSSAQSMACAAPPPRSPEVIVIEERRKRKNNETRARAGQHKKRIVEIARKPKEERTDEEQYLLMQDTIRRQKKNERSRERAQEQKDEELRILALPEEERTEEERQYLATVLYRRWRKNLGDSMRRRTKRAEKAALTPPKKRHKSEKRFPSMNERVGQDIGTDETAFESYSQAAAYSQNYVHSPDGYPPSGFPYQTDYAANHAPAVQGIGAYQHPAYGMYYHHQYRYYPPITYPQYLPYPNVLPGGQVIPPRIREAPPHQHPSREPPLSNEGPDNRVRQPTPKKRPAKESTSPPRTTIFPIISIRTLDDEELLKREKAARIRKNAQVRDREAKVKEMLAMIKGKPEYERTEEEGLLLAKDEHRRNVKSAQSRERAARRKAEMERILATPQDSRTEEEKQWIKAALKAKERKNLGDRKRRFRIKEENKKDKAGKARLDSPYDKEEE